MDGPDYVDFSVQPASVDQKVGPEWFEGFSRDIRDEEHLESSDSVLSQLAGYGPCYIMDGEGYRWKVLGQPHGCDDLTVGQPYPPLWFYPAKEDSVQYIKCRYGKIFVVEGDDALQAMVPTFSGKDLKLEQEDDPKHAAVVGGEDIWLTMLEEGSAGDKVGGAPQDAYRPVTSLDLEVTTEEPTEAPEPANWKPVKVGHYTLDSDGKIKVYNYMTWTLTCTTVDKQSKWWDLTFDYTGSGLTAKVAAGMSEGPTFGDACAIHPQPAWEWLETGAGTHSLSDGTTHFYAKAYFAESEIEMGKRDGYTTSSTATPPPDTELTGYRYALSSVSVEKVIGDQPDDTKTEKHKLLGKIVVSAGKVTDYWWRTNHIFNWTFYSFTVLADAGDEDCEYVLPPNVPGGNGTEP